MNNLVIFVLVVCVLMALALLALVLDDADVHPLRALVAQCRVVVEYLHVQLDADRSQDWTQAELAAASVETLSEHLGHSQRTVPVAEVLGAYMPLPYAPGAHLLGAHHPRAQFGVVTGNYAQIERWTEDTGSISMAAMAELLAEAGAR